MKLPPQLETLAKMLAYILGHHPDEFGLVLDADGFVPLKQLQQALIHEPGWGFVRRHHLDQVVLLMQPPAFEVVEERIRCLQPGPLPQRRPGEPPPALLYLAIPAQGPRAGLAGGPQGAGRSGTAAGPQQRDRFEAGKAPRPRPDSGHHPGSGRRESGERICRLWRGVLPGPESASGILTAAGTLDSGGKT